MGCCFRHILPVQLHVAALTGTVRGSGEYSHHVESGILRSSQKVLPWQGGVKGVHALHILHYAHHATLRWMASRTVRVLLQAQACQHKLAQVTAHLSPFGAPACVRAGGW